MPVYVFECEEGHRFDRFLRLSEYDTPQTCECGAKAQRKIVPTMLNPDMADWDAYISPTSGKKITSYKQRQEDMKKSGCVDYEPSMKEHWKRKVEAEDAALDKKVGETVEKEIHQMDSGKRERLYNELRHSELTYERK